MTKEIHTIEELKDFTFKFLKKIRTKNSAAVLCLSGDLGSGKTTFTQQVASIFGITDHVTSPTFILQKKYLINTNPFSNLKKISQIIHMDMYRIENEKELENLDFNEIINDPKNLLIIEWPEKIKNSIPKEAYRLDFEFVDETTRRVQW